MVNVYAEATCLYRMTKAAEAKTSDEPEQNDIVKNKLYFLREVDNRGTVLKK